MTTEEKQLEKAVKSRLLDRGFNPDKLINNRGLIGAVIEEVLFFEQSNSQPPNLICGGGGQVIDSDYVESLIFEITQLTKENQELKMLIHGLAKKDIENNKLLEISFTKLQAAEDRIKELENGVEQSEQLICEHRWKEYEGPSCRMGWKCSKCKEKVGITQNIVGDFVSWLKSDEENGISTI